MSWDEFSHKEGRTQTQIYILERAACVSGGWLRLRESDLTACPRERVQRVASMRVFMLVFYCKNLCVCGVCNCTYTLIFNEIQNCFLFALIKIHLNLEVRCNSDSCMTSMSVLLNY